VNAFRKSTFTAVLVCLFALAACRPDVRTFGFTPESSGAITGSPDSTGSPPADTKTRTATATATPSATLTQTLTPYPSFDARQAVSRTPAEPAQCPAQAPGFEVVVDLPAKEDIDARSDYIKTLDNRILELLEKGASPLQLADAFDTAFEGCRVDVWDLTGDDVPEVIVYKELTTVVLGCKNGKYAEFLNLGFGTTFSPRIYAIEDMNSNNTPDVVFWTIIGTGSNLGVTIVEWNGTGFTSLLQANHGENSASISRFARIVHWYEDFRTPPGIAIMNGMADMDIRDLDGNGTKELILKDSGPAHFDTLYTFGPWRGRRVVFSWDGLHYLYSALEMDPPKYRFQAVQDADRFFLMGDYSLAEGVYQAVVSSNQLDWWTPERVRFLLDESFAKAAGRPTPVPPEEDETEYPKLAAYAGYRLILLNAVRGDIGSVEGLYADLLKDHPYGSDGYPYVILADRFLENYRATGDPARACEQVVKYIQSVEGLLAPLGDSNHGGQSHIYEAADLCPFP
jgi:hypothetical protein